MSGRGTVGRAVRVGLVVSGVPVLPWAGLCLLVAVVEHVRGGDTAQAAADLRGLGVLLGGGALVGVLTGLVLAGVLTLVSRPVRGTAGLAWAGTLTASVLFPAEFAVVGVASDGGYAEFALTFLLWPVMAAVAGLHAADVVGRARTRDWLWTPWPPGRLRRD
ncbi:hypothetical protein SAMN05428944_2652 [Streptomyces sp. 1222.5]|uniref:hypothetical protein n=1 Tax=unclassified Streptomyces TaxID=2593676 RepID=UPI00089A0274|nr:MULTISPECIES: hypothetical protein [unclassified Streptomyces]PKW10168.1 hypothetical protein BX260_5440 [Streptomyces sp. 5112.2]SEC13388.1 hypothetical protein SAMN05428944_2652 [Streptomyces sp. 1222.5]